MISLPKTKSGNARHIPLDAIACSALQERKRAQQDHAAKLKEKGRDHPTRNLCSGMPDPIRSTNTGAGSMKLWQKRRSRTTPGIATVIPSQVGLLWRGLISARWPN